MITLHRNACLPVCANKTHIEIYLTKLGVHDSVDCVVDIKSFILHTIKILLLVYKSIRPQHI